MVQWKFPLINKMGMVMKNILFTLIFILCVNILYAMTPLNDRQMSKIEAQSGVGIFIDHTYIYHSIDETRFKDPDGISNVQNDGCDLVISSLESDVVRIEGIAPLTTLYDADEQHVQWNAQFKISDSEVLNTFTSSILSIDILDELPSMSAASNFKLYNNPYAEMANVAGIFLRLPTFELYIDEFNLNSITFSPYNISTQNQEKSFGHIKANEVQFDILGGYVEIAPHNLSGVDILIDDLLLYSKVGDIIYFDEDTPSNGNNRFWIDNLKLDVMHINAITHLSGNQPASIGEGLHFTTYNNQQSINTREIDYYDFTRDYWKFRPLKIDLSSRLPIMSALFENQPVAGLHATLPAIEVFIDNLSFSFTTGEEDDEWLGKLLFKNIDIVILEGNLEVSPHMEYGVDLAVDDITMYLSIDKISYNDFDDGGYFNINNFEMDTVHINSIAKDANNRLYSPGNDKVHITQANLNTQRLQEFKPSPFSVDITSNLPKASQHLGQPVAGISVNLPTMETYIDQVGIESITLSHDQSVNNNNSPLITNIKIEGATNAILGGRMEIFTH